MNELHSCNSSLSLRKDRERVTERVREGGREMEGGRERERERENGTWK